MNCMRFERRVPFKGTVGFYNWPNGFPSKGSMGFHNRVPLSVLWAFYILASLCGYYGVLYQASL